MKTKLAFLLVILLPLAAHAADDLSTALQKGLFEEEANQNLPAAIKAYESLLAASDEQRKLAATALFRLGECYRKLGKTNDAVAQYQRLLRDYADQSPLATLSRQNLTGLGVGQTPMPKTDQVSAAVSAEAEELARTERILVQLSGRDLGQVRRLLPTVSPDADFEQYDRLLVEAQEKARTLTGAARDEWRKKEDEYTHLLERRFDQIKGILTERAEQLRARVAVQNAEAGRRQSTDQEDPSTNRAPGAEAAQAEALLTQLRSVGRSELIQVLPTVAPDPLLNSLLERLSEAQAKLASAKTTFADDHPTTKSAAESLKVLDGQLDERLKGILRGMEIKAAALKQQAAATPGSAGENRAVTAAPLSEEEQEIRRIQALIKDSPDLINAANVEVTRIRSGELMVPKNGTLLHKAASLGQLRVATFLLDQGANVGVKDEMGYLPLHWAANNGHRAMSELLLSRKAEVNATVANNARAENGSTPLMLAAKKGFRGVCEVLLARGANPNLSDKYGNTPLGEAAERGDEATLRLLLDKGAEVNRKTSSGSTALHYASSTNVARLLLERGAEINVQNTDGQSPLHGNASSGNLELVELLLKNKADANLKNKNGLTPLDLAAIEGRAGVIAPLIQGGADPNNREGRTSSPLHHAIRKESNSRTGSSDYLATLAALLAGGGNPNMPNPDGSTPLYLAASQGLDQMVEILLKAGADPNLKTDNGYGPIYFVLKVGKERMLEALLAHGADASAYGGGGEIPLESAAVSGSKETVALLLKYKADPNGKTRQGRTPLHAAVSQNRHEIVDLLLAAKASPNATDAQGLSPLDYLKSGSRVLQTGIGFLQPSPGNPSIPGRIGAPTQPASPNDLAARLRKAGARDWAPRPGLITVTRRSTGASVVVFTKGTNVWNRHSLLEVMGFTFFGSSSSFPFPDFSKLKVTRFDPEKGGVREFTIDLSAALAKDGCAADQWLEWGDLIDIPEGEHRLDERWVGLRSEDRQSFANCLSRKVTISVKAKTNTVELVAPSNWVMPVGESLPSRYQAAETFWLNQTVKRSGLLLTSSDLSRVAVRRLDIETGSSQEWAFDLTKEPSVGNDLWLRDGDVIEVPEKP